MLLLQQKDEDAVVAPRGVADRIVAQISGVSARWEPMGALS
jgi:hypothetical protein